MSPKRDSEEPVDSMLAFLDDFSVTVIEEGWVEVQIEI